MKIAEDMFLHCTKEDTEKNAKKMKIIMNKTLKSKLIPIKDEKTLEQSLYDFSNSFNTLVYEIFKMLKTQEIIEWLTRRLSK